MSELMTIGRCQIDWIMGSQLSVWGCASLKWQDDTPWRTSYKVLVMAVTPHHFFHSYFPAFRQYDYIVSSDSRTDSYHCYLTVVRGNQKLNLKVHYATFCCTQRNRALDARNSSLQEQTWLLDILKSHMFTFVFKIRYSFIFPTAGKFTVLQ